MPDPFDRFDDWSRDVEDAAACLATASPGAGPSARMVIVTGHDRHGFRFFTGYDSPKGRDLEADPRAALLWYWPPDRQVRASGRAEALGAAESDDYWASRPREHQLAVWAAPQSAVVGGRGELEERLAEAAERFGEGPVPRPESWGGYRLVADQVEFWRQGEDRLHERVRYRREGGGWVAETLAP
jgi:pyridoxamine 5'-phosphate oxidase